VVVALVVVGEDGELMGTLGGKLKFLKGVTKCGTGLNAGTLGHGLDTGCLMGIPMEAMAMVGELCPRRRDSCA